MNARPIYDSDEYVEVEYRGHMYPFRFNMKVTKLFQERYKDRAKLEFDSMSELDELVWQIAVMFDAAVKTAGYFGLEVPPKVTAEELEDYCDVPQIRELHAKVQEAIRLMNAKVGGSGPKEEWSEEEIKEMGDAPVPDEEEKN